jgi:hypothetical protein
VYLWRLRQLQAAFRATFSQTKGSAGGSSAVSFGREEGQVVQNPLFDAAVANANTASDSPHISVNRLSE